MSCIGPGTLVVRMLDHPNNINNNNMVRDGLVPNNGQRKKEEMWTNQKSACSGEADFVCLRY